MDARTWFATSTNGFLQVVDGLDPARLGDPGLGVWDVRSLLGHASRSFLTLESYVRPGHEGEAALSAPADYYVAVRSSLLDPSEVAERGRRAGLALGGDPVASVREIAHRVTLLVGSVADDCLVESPFGTMSLVAYLATRAFELTVHGIDLARATGQSIPLTLVESAVPAVELCAAMAVPAQRVELLLALTGREILPPGFTVL